MKLSACLCISPVRHLIYAAFTYIAVTNLAHAAYSYKEIPANKIKLFGEWQFNSHTPSKEIPYSACQLLSTRNADDRGVDSVSFIHFFDANEQKEYLDVILISNDTWSLSEIGEVRRVNFGKIVPNTRGFTETHETYFVIRRKNYLESEINGINPLLEQVSNDSLSFPPGIIERPALKLPNEDVWALPPAHIENSAVKSYLSCVGALDSSNPFE